MRGYGNLNLLKIEAYEDIDIFTEPNCQATELPDLTKAFDDLIVVS